MNHRLLLLVLIVVVGAGAAVALRNFSHSETPSRGQPRTAQASERSSTSLPKAPHSAGADIGAGPSVEYVESGREPMPSVSRSQAAATSGLTPEEKWVAESFAATDPRFRYDDSFRIEDLPYDYEVKQALRALANAEGGQRQAIAVEILDQEEHPAYLPALYALADRSPNAARGRVMDLVSEVEDMQAQSRAGQALGMLARQAALSDGDLRAMLVADKPLIRRAAAAALRDRGDDAAWQAFLEENPAERRRWQEEEEKRLAAEAAAAELGR